jgi:hypothetical protein
MVGTWKVLSKASPGSGQEFGSDDLDKVNKLLNGTLNVDTAEINSIFRIRDNKLYLRDPVNLFNYIVRTSGITADRQATLPMLTADDTFTFNNHATTLTNKILAGARVSNYYDVESTSTPANPGANVLRIYRKSTDNTLAYRTNAGTEVVLGAAGGGGSGEINTASNIGTAGIGLFKTKSGFDLQFKKLNTATGGLITVTDDTASNEVDLKVTPSGTDDRYLKTAGGVTIWDRPGMVMPDDSLYDGKRWGTFYGGALDGNGIFSGLVVSGATTGTSGTSSMHKTNFNSGAVDLAYGGVSTKHRVTRPAQNPKFKGKTLATISTERFWFGFHDDAMPGFPGGADPLASNHGIMIGFNETDTNFMVRWNNGTATSQSASTGILKDGNSHTMEVMYHSTPAVSAWFDNTLIVNASTTQVPTSDVACHNLAQSVGGQDVAASIEYLMLYFSPRL